MVVVLPVPFTPTTRIAAGGATERGRPSEVCRKMFNSCALTADFSSAASCNCPRRTCWRTASSTSWVVARPTSPAIKTSSNFSSSASSISVLPRTISSTRVTSELFVDWTAFWKRSKRPGFASGGPNRVWIMDGVPSPTNIAQPENPRRKTGDTGSEENCDGRLLAAGLAEFGGDQRFKDGQNPLAKRDHDLDGFPVPGIVVLQGLPAGQGLRGYVNVPAQAFDRVAAQKEAIEEGSL